MTRWESHFRNRYNFTGLQDEKVISYEDHPDSVYAAPTADHFLPLLYALGAAEGEKPLVFNQVRNLGSISMTGYAFGLSSKGGN